MSFYRKEAINRFLEAKHEELYVDLNLEKIVIHCEHGRWCVDYNGFGCHFPEEFADSPEKAVGIARIIVEHYNASLGQVGPPTINDLKGEEE